MKKYILYLLFVFSLSPDLVAQSFLVSKNVVSTNLISPFLSPGSYGLEFERVLDKGYSPNVSQFTYKLGFYAIDDKDKRLVDSFYELPVYDYSAVKYSGLSTFVELRYYFGWKAPKGYYFTLFGSYSDYNENYTDRKSNSFDSYEKMVSKIGRGVGLGAKYQVLEFLIFDILVGYNVDNVNQNITYTYTQREEKIEPLTKDGLRAGLSIGVNF